MAPSDEPEEPSLETSSEESTALEVVPETPLAETATSPVPDLSPTDPVETGATTVPAPEETAPVSEQAQESIQPEEAEEKAEDEEEEGEPFADILQENKDKKRYSPNPLPEQSSETN